MSKDRQRIEIICPHEDALTDMSMTLALALVQAQGPARAVQIIGIVCQDLAKNSDSPRVGNCMKEIGENLERYAGTVLEHMGEALK